MQDNANSSPLARAKAPYAFNEIILNCRALLCGGPRIEQSVPRLCRRCPDKKVFTSRALCRVAVTLYAVCIKSTVLSPPTRNLVFSDHSYIVCNNKSTATRRAVINRLIASRKKLFKILIF